MVCFFDGQDDGDDGHDDDDAAAAAADDDDASFPEVGPCLKIVHCCPKRP